MRVRKAHVRPGGLKGHGGLRTPRFGEIGARQRPFQSARAGAKRQTFHGHGARGKRATGEVVYKAATAAVLVVLYVLYVLPRRPDCQNGKPPIPPIKAD